MGDPNVTRTKRVAVTLAAVAGFLDVVGYLTLAKLFTAHMTGNTSKLGVALGHGTLFAAGIAAGTLLVDARRRSSPLVLQALLVATFMAIGVSAHRHGDTFASPYPYYVLEACATVALGLQTAALTDIGGTTIRTSYVSGVLTNLTQGAVRRLRGGETDKPLALLSTILLAYLTGATAAGFTLHELGLWCLGFPLAVLLAVAAARPGGA